MDVCSRRSGCQNSPHPLVGLWLACQGYWVCTRNGNLCMQFNSHSWSVKLVAMPYDLQFFCSSERCHAAFESTLHLWTVQLTGKYYLYILHQLRETHIFYMHLSCRPCLTHSKTRWFTCWGNKIVKMTQVADHLTQNELQGSPTQKLVLRHINKSLTLYPQYEMSPVPQSPHAVHCQLPLPEPPGQSCLSSRPPADGSLISFGNFQAFTQQSVPDPLHYFIKQALASELPASTFTIWARQWWCRWCWLHMHAELALLRACQSESQCMLV